SSGGRNYTAPPTRPLPRPFLAVVLTHSCIIPRAHMSLNAGSRLGPHEIISPIGAGGMGEVYKAKDTRLGRDVAVKVAAEQFSERFEREARAISALNHPHICTLHDVGPNYLVMELVEGATLRSPMSMEDALS